MAGKVLKIVSNDLYGNVDDRKIKVFACFEHTKYMNNYVVFSFIEDNNNNKLYYGSIHLKDKSLIIFEVKSSVKNYIDSFLEQYLSNSLTEYKILDISNLQKVELVSYNDMEYDKIQILEDKSIIKSVVHEELVKENKPIFMYILLLVLILFAIGITLLYFKPELFVVKYKGLECTNNMYDDKIELSYKINKDIRFDRNDKVEKISVVRTYAFLDSDSYEKFKNSNAQNKYFTNGEGYKYNDSELTFKLFYDEKTVIDDYDEMLTYLNREGYICVETEYEE